MINRPLRPETIMTLTKVSTKIQRLAKIHFTYKETKIQNTQDMPQNEINCFQIVKLISADFGSVWWFYNVLQFCSKNSKKEGPQFLIAQSGKHSLRFIDTIILGISCWVTVCLNMFSKIRWKNWWKLIWVMFIHKYTKIELKCIM